MLSKRGGEATKGMELAPGGFLKKRGYCRYLEIINTDHRCSAFLSINANSAKTTKCYLLKFTVQPTMCTVQSRVVIYAGIRPHAPTLSPNPGICIQTQTNKWHRTQQSKEHRSQQNTKHSSKYSNEQNIQRSTLVNVTLHRSQQSAEHYREYSMNAALYRIQQSTKHSTVNKTLHSKKKHSTVNKKLHSQQNTPQNTEQNRTVHIEVIM